VCKKLVYSKLLDAANIDKKRLLDWQVRARIIEGIAQGLLYLHQYSRLRIIHIDLKASNILLDSGYMPPEYALRGFFSIKSDVFSFGVLMLEILSGKKSTAVYNTGSFNLLGHAWDLWKDDRVHELIDPVITQDEISLSMLMRYVKVALLCVQETAADRPTMSDVVSMISNEHLNLCYLKKPAFVRSKNVKNSSHSNSGTSEFCSVNDITVSLINSR
ncbi:hypothetical protein CICLE_v10010676mg, partial [Citrus x clementina]